MANLSDLGFKKGVVVETILSSYNADGSSNAAPMGATMIDEKHVAVTFYNSSRTFANVKAEKSAVLNITTDIWVYYRTALKESNAEGRLPDEWFAVTDMMKAPRLRSAEATIELKLIELTALGKDKTRAVFAADKTDAVQGYPKAYSRAFGATVEAIVHATHIKALNDGASQRKLVETLLLQIQMCRDVICRVAPGSAYEKVIDDLLKRVGKGGHA